jgi:hypothetical protein
MSIWMTKCADFIAFSPLNQGENGYGASAPSGKIADSLFL